MNKLTFKSGFTTLLASLTLIAGINAQISIPSPSPGATVTQKIGIVETKVEFSRPSAKGRKVFGDVVPFGKIWRTGANSPTKITFGDTLIINGKKLPGGTYAIYTIPTETSWTVILNSKSTVSAGDYKEGDEAFKFTVTPEKLPYAVETFEIGFKNLGYASADLVICWENISIKFKVENDPDRKITSEIKAKLESTDLYWQAANYYYDSNKDLKQALEWANKVVEKNPRYWTIHLKAKIYAKIGDCNNAVASANQSKEMATKESDDAYVKLNDKIIAGCPVTAAPVKKKK